jgi:hypothetical protein
MKKLTPEKVVGMNAEDRVISLIRSLRGDHKWIGRPRKAGKMLDEVGIDVVVPLNVLEGDKPKVIAFAVQVKHSYGGLEYFRKEHPEALEAGVTPIVAHTLTSDRTLIKKLDRLIVERIYSPELDKTLEAYMREAKRQRRSKTLKGLKGEKDDTKQHTVVRQVRRACKREHYCRAPSAGRWRRGSVLFET